MIGMSMDSIAKLKAWAQENRQRLIDELLAFLSQPSVSTTGLGIEETVRILKDELVRLGFETRILTLDGAYPVVFGEAGDKNALVSLCIYGHYDVQDPDPLSEWHSDPFKPEIRNNRIYARGATDDKGNLFANIKAAEAVQAVFQNFPCTSNFSWKARKKSEARICGIIFRPIPIALKQTPPSCVTAGFMNRDVPRYIWETRDWLRSGCGAGTRNGMYIQGTPR